MNDRYLYKAKRTDNGTVDFELIDFGKSVFLTQEEAEAALAEWSVRYE